MSLGSYVIQSGRLRHRVSHQREEQTPDGAGGYTVGWVEQGDFWASVEPMVGSESLEARQLEDAVTHKIVCRAPRDIKAADRIVFDGRVFNVRVVRRIREIDSRLEIDAEEGVAT